MSENILMFAKTPNFADQNKKLEELGMMRERGKVFGETEHWSHRAKSYHS